MSPMGRMGRWGLLHPAHARGPEVTVPGGLSDAQLRTNYPSQKNRLCHLDRALFY